MIHSFTRGHFFGHPFPLASTLYFFTAGRYEFRNKGIDLFVQALGRLNAVLKEVNSEVTVVAFIICPSEDDNRGYGRETLKGHAVVSKLKENVAEIEKRIGERIFESALQ